MSKLSVQESNNNYYPIVYNLYDSVYECKNFEYAKYTHKKCIIEKQLADITTKLKETENKMFVYNFNNYFTKSLQFSFLLVFIILLLSIPSDFKILSVLCSFSTCLICSILILL